MLMTLHHAHVISILRCVVVIGEGSSRQGILSGGPPLSLFDMLLATRRGWELDIPFVVHLLRWFFVFLHRSFHLFIVFPLFLVF
jgi:hypothetical protein